MLSGYNSDFFCEGTKLEHNKTVAHHRKGTAEKIGNGSFPGFKILNNF